MACLVGSLTTFISYSILGYCYNKEVSSFILLSIAFILVGFGSTCGLYSAVACCTTIFPEYRGTVSAFPVSMYVLSGMAFSAICNFLYGSDVKNVLGFLSIVCPSMTVVGFFTIEIFASHTETGQSRPILNIDTDSYHPIASTNPYKTGDSPGTPIVQPSVSNLFSVSNNINRTPKRKCEFPKHSRILSSSSIEMFDNAEPQGRSQSEGLIDNIFQSKSVKANLEHPAIKAIKNPTFFIYYIIWATIQGIGQMYIYSVEFIVKININFLENQQNQLNAEQIQSAQVSILSLMSCVGRLSSGAFSDYLVNKLNSQRLWNIFIATVIIVISSIKLVSVSDPFIKLEDISNMTSSSKYPNEITNISICSALFGLTFDMLFGTFPSIIAEAFGCSGFSIIWGLVTSGGLFTVKFFTALLGNELSEKEPSKDLMCLDGPSCYKGTFKIVEIAALMMSVLTLCMIYLIHIRKIGQNKILTHLIID